MPVIKYTRLFAALLVLFTALACNAGPGHSVNDSTARAKPTDSADHTNVKPAALPAAADTTNAVVALVKQALTTKLLTNDLKSLNSDDRQFTYSTADINGDGRPEIFAGMKGRYFCGSGGCTVYLLNNKGEKITAFTIVSGPIIISNHTTKGWHDLIVPSSGTPYLVQFNGKAYPSNPSVQPKYTGTTGDTVTTVLPDNAAVLRF
ncbi:hypothetical protein [Deminuibacter soli]|uniref:VCBS repeat-containing protein n=1 Tax=Deminuibacter soli TaxID=2291815 RepID=A0A3E1NHR9_9BACT|nr:hypothetical protein [Deminuibacter soli]RFM27500.1 hypothetical protein DXN05_15940 [Deminuibacter soli]